jgi:uncharacterized protein (TIGR00369 family)
MDDMSSPPPGFARLDMDGEFADGFGPVYFHKPTRRMGFFVAARHLNPIDTCHGGALATFADMQIAAVREAPGVGSKHLPTVSLSVDYVAPAQVGAWVEAVVTLTKVTRTLIFTQALLTVEGEVVARSTAIYRNRR